RLRRVGRLQRELTWRMRISSPSKITAENRKKSRRYVTRSCSSSDKEQRPMTAAQRPKGGTAMRTLSDLDAMIARQKNQTSQLEEKPRQAAGSDLQAGAIAFADPSSARPALSAQLHQLRASTIENSHEQTTRIPLSLDSSN